MKTLQDYLEYEQPTKYRVLSDEYNNNYSIPVLTAGQTFILGYTNETLNVFPEVELPVIIFDDFTTAIQYVDFPFKVKSSAMKILHAKDNNNIRFLYYLLKSIKIDSSTHKRYWISEFAPKEVNEFSIEEQDKIANELDAIDSAINNRKHMIEDLDLLIKSKFSELFGNLECNSKKYPLKSIRELVSNDIKRVKKEYKENETIKYIDISCLDNQKNKVINFVEYKIGCEPSRAQQCIKQNDILMSTVRPNLKNIAVNNYNYNNMVGTSGFCVLRCIGCKVEYLLSVLLSDSFTNSMISKTTGSNYPAIRNNDVLDYLVPLPPESLQNKYAEIVNIIQDVKEKYEMDIKDLEQLMQIKILEYFDK